MQRPDEAKRQAILRVAGELFARKPFHAVRLDDVAAAAHVGKGTLYVYFDSKEHLYVEMISATLQLLLRDLKQFADEQAPVWESLERMTRRLAEWIGQRPELFDLMRDNVHVANGRTIRSKRRRMGELFGEVLRRGVDAGELDDPHPELTGQLIPAMLRAGVVWMRPRPDTASLTRHVLHLLQGSLARHEVAR